MTRETWCPDCDRPVGVMTPPMTPRAHTGPRKRVKHGNPALPRINDRMQECAGSRMEVDDTAIYEVTPGAREARRRHRTELTKGARV